MQKQPFGTTGRDVAVTGQGTWNIEAARRPDAIRAIQTGLDLGMTHIDTAEMYGDGASEALVGAAIRERREEVFLVSKVLPANASRKGVMLACERSLRQLATDYLDCYLLHWRGSYPLAETFAAFDALRREGKIRAFGVSNFDVDDLDEAVTLLGPGELACNQVLYHIRERAIEHAVLPWCLQHGVALVAYSPFGQLDFPAPASTGGRILAALAGRHNATPRQIALAFLTRTAGVFAIPKSANADHVTENAGAGNLKLTDAECAALDKVFPRGKRPATLPVI